MTLERVSIVGGSLYGNSFPVSYSSGSPFRRRPLSALDLQVTRICQGGDRSASL